MIFKLLLATPYYVYHTLSEMTTGDEQRAEEKTVHLPKKRTNRYG
jgi:hypothetical protein